MELKALSYSKEEAELEIDSLTLAELLRVYLNKDSAITFAAWKRDHPTKNPILSVKVKGKTVKKAINDAINEIEKELDKVENNFKKLK